MPPVEMNVQKVQIQTAEARNQPDPSVAPNVLQHVHKKSATNVNVGN